VPAKKVRGTVMEKFTDFQILEHLQCGLILLLSKAKHIVLSTFLMFNNKISRCEYPQAAWIFFNPIQKCDYNFYNYLFLGLKNGYTKKLNEM
jgi:hypothetical protein